MIKKLLKKILDWFRKSKDPNFEEEYIHPTEHDESDDLEEYIHPTEHDESDDLEEDKRLQSEDTH